MIDERRDKVWEEVVRTKTNNFHHRVYKWLEAKRRGTRGYNLSYFRTHRVADCGTPRIRPTDRVLVIDWSATVSTISWSTTAVLTVLAWKSLHESPCKEARKDLVSRNCRCKLANVLELGNHVLEKNIPVQSSLLFPFADPHIKCISAFSVFLNWCIHFD